MPSAESSSSRRSSDEKTKAERRQAHRAEFEGSKGPDAIESRIHFENGFLLHRPFLNDHDVLMRSVLLHVNIKYSVQDLFDPVTRRITLQAVVCGRTKASFLSQQPMFRLSYMMFTE